MIKDKGIFIKNVYYMLAYAYQFLNRSNYEHIASEKFENIQDLFSAILASGIAQQLKQGLFREYVVQRENLSTMRGKLDIYGTIKNKLQRKQVLACEFDELSENNIYNQILKATALILSREKSVEKENRKALKKLLLFFHSIDELDPATIRWNTLRFQRNNQHYQMLLNICYFVLDGLLQTTEHGQYKMTAFSDEHMHRLFERFVREYYRCHHNYLRSVDSERIDWALDDTDERAVRFLPSMKTDVTLRYKEKVLIIDTKYYSQIMQSHFDKLSLRSNHLYQIFTYVKNRDAEHTGNVSGLLLYAKTGEAITPDFVYNMGGNRISAKTLDLNNDFNEIKRQLDKIAEDHFGVHEVAATARR
jgi:5-methylcytosine-specific restriction enzyme subunit McrC